jgi:hypothetical protein
VLFIDKPFADAPVGIWGVGLEGGEPALYTERLGFFSADMQFLAYPERGETIVEYLADGQRWTIPSGGRAISFSPYTAQISWTAGQDGPPFDTAAREVWVSQMDGSQAVVAARIIGGGLSGWLPDGRLLLNGRLSMEEEKQGYFIWSPQDGALVEIARGARLRGAVLSPGGAWLAYLATFEEDPAANGLWLVNTGTLERRRLDLFGAYRWRDDGRLLMIPLDMGASTHQLWEVEAATGLAHPLTDPAVTPFKVANGDWAVSPDGWNVVFVSAGDNNLWLLMIGEG